MSRNDMYLSLCLEQAAMSPLHYRHGSVIVRGGKVIGKGFNDYRSGYNGGTLSSGQLNSASAINGPAIRALKEKNKGNAGNKQLRNVKLLDKPTHSFNASANDVLRTGGSCLASSPLSMHSEMMAINSALSLSSNIACQGTARTTQWLQKPCFKLPSRSKRRDRLQRLKAYADAVYNEVSAHNYAALERCGMSKVQGSRFEPCSDVLCGALQGGQLQQGAATRGREAAAGGAVSTGEQSYKFGRASKNQCVAGSHEVSERETPEAVSVRHTTDQSYSSPPPPSPPPSE